MNKREKINYISHNLSDSLLLIISLIIIFGAGIYYLYALNWVSICIILALVIITFIILNPILIKHSENEQDNKNIAKIKEKIKYFAHWPLYLYLIFFILCFIFLFTSQSDKAIISPWQLISPYFFVFYTLCSLSLVFILSKKGLSTTSKLITTSLHYFLSFSVAAIIYKIGYGFDPFVHQATMELIDKKGLVTPKPFYYLGEYSLVVILHKLSALSIYTINKFLVPVLAAFFLPLSFYRLARQNNLDASRWLIPIFLLALTFSPFILTTPQNLSYLFLILTIIFGLVKSNPLWSLILAISTTAIHPLTGIPALCWWLALILYKNYSKLTKKRFHLYRTLLFLSSALVLPLALFISGGSSLKNISFDFHFIIEPLKNLFLNLSSAGQENWLLNLAYFFGYNYNLWLVLAIAASLVFFYRRGVEIKYRSLIFINFALVIAYLLSSQIVFTDLINYEQTNFSSRLLILITIFFLPLLISALQALISLIIRQDKISRIAWLILGAALISASLYISYPRYDNYFNSRGYSTSASDIAAVNLINKEARGPYIVLANQQVSVAALKEIGFDHYYNTKAGPLYFYPIPTGGELYKYYLDMVYKNPSRETMASARSLAGVKVSYLVVNKYWFQSSRVINAAKLSADSWQSVNGEDYIFKYLP